MSDILELLEDLERSSKKPNNPFDCKWATPAMLTATLEDFYPINDCKVGDFVRQKPAPFNRYKSAYGIIIRKVPYDQQRMDQDNPSDVCDIIIGVFKDNGILIELPVDSRYFEKMDIDPHSTDTFETILKRGGECEGR